MSEMPLFDELEEREEDRVYSVAEVNREVRFALEDDWGDILIEGELSNVSRAAAGHVYFTLNDEEKPAQLRGVMFRSDAVVSKVELADGNRVRFRGRLSLYEARGQFQLIARTAVEAGEGDLAAMFRKTRAKLEAEGLFDVERKRELPALPRCVGLVTSVKGAAIRDVVRVAADRCPVPIVVADCRVQGAEAPGTIVEALELIVTHPTVDVVILTRGGGSAEDLWAFNDERVARAVAACPVPVVCGVGHEVDVTIADLVADVRAATPSNAAEIAVPEKAVLLREVAHHERRLVRALESTIGQLRLQLAEQTDFVRSHDPRARLARNRLRYAEQLRRLRAAGQAPVVRGQQALKHWTTVLRTQAGVVVPGRRARFERELAKLDALSPLRVLDRGYAIAIASASGKAITSPEQVSTGDSLRIRVAKGEFGATVDEDD